MPTLPVVDVDAHLTEPPGVWVDRIAARHHERVPHVERRGGADVWVLDGQQVATVGGGAPAGATVGLDETAKTYADVHPAAFDADARLAYLDEVGIWAQVLYPNVAGFGGQRFLRLEDPELMLLCVRAYNDFLTEWCSADPTRLLGVAATPFWDPAAAANEVERAAELGHRGILMTGEPQAFGMPHIGDAHWEPLWRAAESAGLPIHYHLGSGDMSRAFTPERLAAHGLKSTYAFTAVELFMKNATQVCDLLLSGVLERHPDLRFVSVESGIGWIPFMLQAADYSWGEARVPHQGQKTLPSELFERQVYATCWFELLNASPLDPAIPVSNILFETDFPHPICLYGNVQEVFEHGMSAIAEDDRRRILWENAADLYRLAVPEPSRFDMQVPLPPGSPKSSHAG